MKRRASGQRSQAPSRSYNLTMALSKVDMAPLDKLDARLLGIISRSHGVPIEVLEQRLAERRAREAAR